MCIICIKYQGIKPPTDKILTAMFKNNPNGAGLMYWKPGEKYIHAIKGITKLADWLATCDLIKQEYNCVYHCRITTQGASTEYTHPFPITSDKNALKYKAWKGTEGVAHNGVIPLTSTYNWTNEESDTALFIRNYWRKLFPDANAYTDEGRLELLGEATNSRWAIMTPGRIYTAGDGWIKDKESGLYFSNRSFEEAKSIKSYSYYYKDEDDDYWTRYQRAKNDYLIKYASDYKKK